MSTKHQKGLKVISLVVMVCFLLNFILVLPDQAAAGEQDRYYSADQLAEKAIEFIESRYEAGEEIDGYTAYVLTLAGEDLSLWEDENGISLKDQLASRADLLGNEVGLISYLTKTQNADGTFGPYANEYGSAAPLEALGAVREMVSGEVYAEVEAAVEKAVNYFRDRYQSGRISYEADGITLNYRSIEALVEAGADLAVADWVYEEKSLKDTVIQSAVRIARALDLQDSEVYEAVDLAKQLRALFAVEPSSPEIDTLAGAIKDKQKEDGSFGTTIYDHVTVLTALGKTGNLSGIDEAGALSYLDGFRTDHEDMWGNPAGSAWGGWEDKESDLTAQVLVALSYFGSTKEVAGLIEDGLAYLQDIQDLDIGAIPHAWDSTFATAETLLALQALGEDYLEAPWLKESRTKTIAQFLMALNEMGDKARSDRLAGLLAGRHDNEGSFENSVYSDFWAYLALAKADKLGLIDREAAQAYVTGKQSAEGAWGETFGEDFYADFVSTTQALRMLYYLDDDSEVVKEAIRKGLDYLKEVQQEDGGIYVAGWDDPALDDGEALVTLYLLGEDPEAFDWTQTIDEERVNPVSYLSGSTLNEDGSFGSQKNLYGAAAVLRAALLQEERDLIGVVQKGINYLASQYDSAENFLEEHGGYIVPEVLTLAGEDLAGDKWTRDEQSLVTEVAGQAAGITDVTKVTEVAKTLLALAGLNNPDETECLRLAGLIAAGQKGSGNFVDGEIYNEILLYLALTEAEGWDMLKETDRQAAVSWLVNAQTIAGPEQGSWQHSWGIDTVATAQAVQVLSAFSAAAEPESTVAHAVCQGLEWLNSKQEEDGCILGSDFDDPVADTAAAVLAVLAVEEDPRGADWSENGQNLIDYLLQPANQNEDGSIGDQANYSGNIYSTAFALHALLAYNAEFGWVDFGSVEGVVPIPPSGQTPGGSNKISVQIAVVGKNKELLYGPRRVTLEDNTALGVLQATGLEYHESGGLVTSIAGQRNAGMEGWMYKVNGVVPGCGASEKQVQKGDRVIWWYSDDPNSDGPNWEDLSKLPVKSGEKELPAVEIPENLQLAGELLSSLKTLLEQLELEEGALLEELQQPAVALAGEQGSVDFKELIAAVQVLAKNTVNLVEKVEAGTPIVLADPEGELALSLPEGALKQYCEITIRELPDPEAGNQELTGREAGETGPEIPSGCRLLSGIYACGPARTVFEEPGTLVIKIVIPPLVPADSIMLARYDGEVWSVVPAVVDLDKGLVLAQISGFSEYAVVAHESRRSFMDVNASSFDWVQDTVERLAGSGIIKGVDGEHFEPGRPVTRAEAVSILVRALRLPDTEVPVSFTDVDENAWYARSLAAALEAGLVAGYADGSFGPEKPVNREELVALVVRARGLEVLEDENLSFKDAGEISDWAKRTVATAVKHELVKGYADGCFRPLVPTSRAECAALVYRMLEDV